MPVRSICAMRRLKPMSMNKNTIAATNMALAKTKSTTITIR